MGTLSTLDAAIISDRHIELTEGVKLFGKGRQLGKM